MNNRYNKLAVWGFILAVFSILQPLLRGLIFDFGNLPESLAVGLIFIFPAISIVLSLVSLGHYKSLKFSRLFLAIVALILSVAAIFFYIWGLSFVMGLRQWS